MSSHILSNSVFLKNLSPLLTTDIVREFLTPHIPDPNEILRIEFKMFAGTAQRYCQVDFRTSSGVTAATSQNGQSLLGVPLVITVIDPTIQASLRPPLLSWGYGGVTPSLTDSSTDHLLSHNIGYDCPPRETEEQQLARTVHVANVPQIWTLREVIDHLIAHVKQEHALTLVVVDSRLIDGAASDFGNRVALIEFKTTEMADAVRNLPISSRTIDSHELIISRAKTTVTLREPDNVSFNLPPSVPVPVAYQQLNKLKLQEKISKAKALADRLASKSLNQERKQSAISSQNEISLNSAQTVPNEGSQFISHSKGDAAVEANTNLGNSSFPDKSTSKHDVRYSCERKRSNSNKRRCSYSSEKRHRDTVRKCRSTSVRRRRRNSVERQLDDSIDDRSKDFVQRKEGDSLERRCNDLMEKGKRRSLERRNARSSHRRRDSSLDRHCGYTVQRHAAYSPEKHRRSRDRRHRYSMEKYREYSPGRHQSRSPEKRSSRSLEKRASRSLEKRRGRSPEKRRGRSPEKRRGRSPEKRRGHSLERRRIHSPERRRDYSHERRRDYSHERRRGHSHQRRRDQSFDRRRDSSHGRRRGHSVERRRGHSVERRRGYSPERRRGHSPEKRRESLLKRRRGYSPKRHRGHSLGRPNSHVAERRHKRSTEKYDNRSLENRHHDLSIETRISSCGPFCKSPISACSNNSTQDEDVKSNNGRVSKSKDCSADKLSSSQDKRQRKAGVSYRSTRGKRSKRKSSFCSKEKNFKATRHSFSPASHDKLTSKKSQNRATEYYSQSSDPTYERSESLLKDANGQSFRHASFDKDKDAEMSKEGHVNNRHPNVMALNKHMEGGIKMDSCDFQSTPENVHQHADQETKGDKQVETILNTSSSYDAQNDNSQPHDLGDNSKSVKKTGLLPLLKPKILDAYSRQVVGMVNPQVKANRNPTNSAPHLNTTTYDEDIDERMKILKEELRKKFKKSNVKPKE